ncbi:MAG: hypothetical protein HFH82_06165 [Lachnospiraceae bacterium]|nr:hypothetical protein [Lachnospiraceae bacterium]
MKLHPLRQGKASGYTTFGCMWKQGACGIGTEYECKNVGQNVKGKVPLQSRITAYWPDGTVKWTAHTADTALLGDEIEVLPVKKDELHMCDGKSADINYGEPVEESLKESMDMSHRKSMGMLCLESEEEIILQAGSYTITIVKDGRHLFSAVEQDGKSYLCNGEGVLLLEEPAIIQGNPARMEKGYVSSIEKITIEETGDLKTIIRYDGIHKSVTGETKFPFVIRMEAGYNKPEIKFTHTFLYDGDENKDFLKGIGVRFYTPVEGALYHRHVKFMGDHGVFHEALAPLTAWKPRLPKTLYERQMQGEKLCLTADEKKLVDRMLQDGPVWSEYVLCQDSVSHFGIQKKLRGKELCYIDSLHGVRTVGGGGFGSEYGSVTVAIRDFWEKYPSGLSFQGLDGEMAECTMWFWAPQAPVMDFRHYASRGYNQVCYEGYDYKGATPDGIACTNECSITFSGEMIPSDEGVKSFAALVNEPVHYVGTPEFYHDMRAFGYWSLPLPSDRATETENWLELQLEQIFAFYKDEIEQRNWYGMFNYGDVMHTYDSVRHQWKYDVGGYAWDNTELVPTLWLWFYFLRTGRKDVYKVAEKLSRHASEVDVYHMGNYKGLGSRHNVRHWGCPCKEARIAMAGHHRVLYYLTGDRRLEDIFEELKDNEMSFLNKDPLGDFFDRKDMIYPSHARSGPDWSSLCSNWMTHWERVGDERYREKIMTGIRDIRNTPLRLVSGPDFEFDPATCHLRYIGERTTGGCHLQICMGAPQIWTELGDLLGDEEWKRMLAELGQVYFMTKEERDGATGGLIEDRQFTFPMMATGIGAYGAVYLKSKVLAERVWKELLGAILSEHNKDGFVSAEVLRQGNQKVLKEIPWISTNFVSQFCLNVIMVLDFIRDSLPETMEEAMGLIGKGDEQFHRA